jgi:hypothetical protein
MGKGSKAPAGYQPTWQSGADQNYQGLIQNATPYAASLPGQVAPGLGQAAQNVVNNPYYQQGQDAANTTAAMGVDQSAAMNGRNINLDQMAALSQGLNSWQGGVMSPLISGSQTVGQQSANIGNGALNVGRQGLSETQGLIPSTTQGGQYAAGQLGNADMLANLTAGTALGAIPGLTGGMDAAQQVLNTGFDPQGALYNRTQQQVTDQQNALNSMYGLGSSAYGAGLAGQANENFNIDWQNQQLARQTQALGAYGQEQGVVENNLTGLLGSAAGNYANLTNAGVNQYTGLTSNAVGNLTNLVNSGSNAYNSGASLAMQGQQQKLAGLAQAGALTNDTVANSNALNSNAASMFSNATQQGQDALQTYLSTQQAPMQAYQNQQQAALAALTSQAQGTQAALAPSQAVGQMDSDYMSLGQGATANAQNAAKINQSSAAGLGKLVGTAAAIALAPATGGMSLFAMGAG